MSRKFSITACILVFIIVIAIPTECFSQNIRTQVENVKINKEKFRNTWGVVGLVRNMEPRPIKGYVKIKYLNANGDIVQSHSAFLNDGDFLQPGQAGPFEYWDDPSSFNGVVSFNVIFIERKN